MKIAICDDDAWEIEETAALVHRFAASQENISVSLFVSPRALLEDVTVNGPHDIYLLDILMPGMNGISLGERLREKDEDGLLIYLSSSEDYYPEAFRVYAFQYMIKPLQADMLFPVLQRALRQLHRDQDQGAAVRTPDGIVFVPFVQTIYVEQLDRVLHYHLAGGKEIKGLYTRSSFEESVKPFLHKPHFVRTHRAFLANLDFVKRVETKSFRMEGDLEVPLSRSFAANAKSRYIQYLMEKKREAERKES